MSPERAPNSLPVTRWLVRDCSSKQADWHEYPLDEREISRGKIGYAGILFRAVGGALEMIGNDGKTGGLKRRLPPRRRLPLLRPWNPIEWTEISGFFSGDFGCLIQRLRLIDKSADRLAAGCCPRGTY